MVTDLPWLRSVMINTAQTGGRRKKVSIRKAVDLYQGFWTYGSGCVFMPYLVPPGILSPLVDCEASLWDCVTSLLDRKRRETSHRRKMGRTMFSMELQISSINRPASESILPVDRNQRTSPAKRMRIAQRSRLLLFTSASTAPHIQNEICSVLPVGPARGCASRRGG